MRIPTILTAAMLAAGPAMAQDMSAEEAEACYVAYQKAILLQDGYDLTPDVTAPTAYDARLEAAQAHFADERRVALTQQAAAELTADILASMESVFSAEGAGPVLEATAEEIRGCDEALGVALDAAD